MRKLSDVSSRDLTSAAEDGGRVAALLGFAHRLDHERLHVGEPLEVRVEDLGRFAGRDAEALAEPVRLHPVREAVVDHLGEAALRVIHRRLVDVEHLGGGRGVNVGAALEGVDQPGVLGEVGEHPQLDLRVVGGEQSPAFLGDEGATHLATVGGAHRHVLQVRRLARDAPGRGVGLFEGGVDATVGPDQRRQRVGVGAAQLLDFAVAQEIFDDRVVVGHLLERVGVGRRAGLRLLHRDQPELLEQDGAQLRGGVHVELLPRVRVDPLYERLTLLSEIGAERLEELAIDPDADRLHARQHPHQRPLEPFVEVGELARRDRLLERVGQLQDDHGPTAGLFDLEVAVEVEGPRLGIR